MTSSTKFEFQPKFVTSCFQRPNPTFKNFFPIFKKL